VSLLPLTVGSTVGPLVLYRPLARRHGHAVPLVAGFSCSALGIAVLSATGPRTSYLIDLAGLLLTGAASTTAFSALTSLLMSAPPAGQSGLGSGLQNASRQSGALIAVSVLGSVLETALPAGRLAVPFAILGLADITGIILGVAALRVPVSAASLPLRSRGAALCQGEKYLPPPSF
jgi:DHA2 family methylenomycin A resistance protein-like MFS transporter